MEQEKLAREAESAKQKQLQEALKQSSTNILSQVVFTIEAA